MTLAPATPVAESRASLTHNDPTQMFSTHPHPPSRPHERTDAESLSAEHKWECSALKILVGVWESQHQHQGKAQIRRAGKAQHQHQIRTGSQHRHCTGRAEAVFRQGVLESNLSAQCCYSQHSIRLSPRSGCYPVRSGCYPASSAFQNEPPSEPEGTPQNLSVDTRGELRLPPGFPIRQRTDQKAAPLTPRNSEPGPHEQRSLSRGGRATLRSLPVEVWQDRASRYNPWSQAFPSGLQGAPFAPSI